MIDAEYLQSSLATADTSLRWWPVLALLLGISVIVIGGILLSP